ncbi:MAG TPA: hypothetical protein VFS40_14300 [Gemmatimonadales bacterium]|nr:hypothetical protein [Gemmatimonadales bacterium]
MPARPTPFELALAPLAAERFPALREAILRGDVDPRDRDAFLMVPEAVALVHELRPDEAAGDALGEGIDQLAALVQHAYLFWAAGARTVSLAEDALERLLAPEGAKTVAPATSPAPPPAPPPAAWYAQLPERRVWAQLAPEEPHEPLDGVFVHETADGLRVLGVFGLLPGRPGFTVAEAAGPAPRTLARLDGTDLFAPALPGGAAAGLHSLVGGEELLELGWRTRTLARPEAGA